MEKIKNFIKHTPFYGPINFFREAFEVRKWEKNGRIGTPPHPIKQNAVREYALRFGTDILIETGTYLGQMVSAVKKDFAEIFSIELDKKLSEKAAKKFRKLSHIHIINGDSGKVLPEIMDLIKKPCLFWLDAHYSSGITARGELETPIAKELETILNHSILNHVILIDDARFFVGKNDYPTLEWLKKYISERRPLWNFEVKHNIIRICPKESQK